MPGKIDTKLETIHYYLEIETKDNVIELIADIHVQRPNAESKTPATGITPTVSGIVCDKTRVQIWRGYNGSPDRTEPQLVGVIWTGNQVTFDFSVFGHKIGVVCEEGKGGELVFAKRSPAFLNSQIVRRPSQIPDDCTPFDDSINIHSQGNPTYTMYVLPEANVTLLKENERRELDRKEF